MTNDVGLNQIINVITARNLLSLNDFPFNLILITFSVAILELPYRGSGFYIPLLRVVLELESVDDSC